MTKHYPYGGSTAARTLQCEAWKSLSKGIPNDSNDFADEGTLLHNAMEVIYDTDRDSIDCIGMQYEEQVLTEELCNDKLLVAVGAMDTLLDEYDINDDYLCEVEVVLIPEVAGGTIDFFGIGHITLLDNEGAKVALFVDYKFGYNDVAPDSDQNFKYAASALTDPKTAALLEDIDIFIFAIVQPAKADSREDGLAYEVFETTYQDICDWADEYEVQIKHMETTPVEELVPTTGPACKYCPANAFNACPAKNGQALRTRQLAPALIANLEEGMAMVDSVESWCKTLRKTMHKHLESGTITSDNWKLVPKRGSRIWSDEPAALKLLKNARKLKLEDGTTLKMKSPTQMEAACKKAGYDYQKFAPLVVMHSSGTTLAPMSDKRTAVPSVGGLKAAMDSVAP